MKKYLIPHEGNDYRAHLLRPATIAFVCLIAVAMESFFLLSSSFIQPHSRLFGLIVANALVDESNQARAANDIPPLNENPLLDAAAQEKANDMVANNYFAHTSPTGVTPWYWFQNVGYDFVSAGENLAVNFSDSQDVTDAWMNSAEHRANILNAGYTDIGMASAQGTFQGHPAIYVVELFGTPAIAPLAFVNTAGAQAPPAVASKAPVAKPVTKSVPPATPGQIAAANATTSEGAVAIKGASIQVGATDIATTAVEIPAFAAVTAPVPAPESNPIQRAASDPRRIVDYFYLAIAILFAAALFLNIFIKVRIQHPHLIFGGMLVVLIAGLFIVMNQHFGLANPVIL